MSSQRLGLSFFERYGQVGRVLLDVLVLFSHDVVGVVAQYAQELRIKCHVEMPEVALHNESLYEHLPCVSRDSLGYLYSIYGEHNHIQKRDAKLNLVCESPSKYDASTTFLDLDETKQHLYVLVQHTSYVYTKSGTNVYILSTETLALKHILYIKQFPWDYNVIEGTIQYMAVCNNDLIIIVYEDSPTIQHVLLVLDRETTTFKSRHWIDPTGPCVYHSPYLYMTPANDLDQLKLTLFHVGDGTFTTLVLENMEMKWTNYSIALDTNDRIYLFSGYGANSHFLIFNPDGKCIKSCFPGSESIRLDYYSTLHKLYVQSLNEVILVSEDHVSHYII